MLALEAAGLAAQNADAVAAAGVHQRLHQRLVPLIGVEGMRALFARSVNLTCSAFPELTGLQNTGLRDAANIGKELAETLQSGNTSDAHAAAASLYANFLELTATLIGERLVFMVLNRAFPTLDVAARLGV
ncbi:MAG: hypothetical protein ABUL62_17025 [Myxococcales bacterium]